MCDQRERLIGYLYEECAPAERREIEHHLGGCATCREEVQAFRQVRADLLAWDVPGTPAIWRPLPVPITQVWWRQVPAWAVAAAASLVLLAGVTGGVAARALAPESPAIALAPPAGPAVASVNAAAVTPAELAAAEQRLIDQLRQELRSAPRMSAQTVGYGGTVPSDQLLRRIEDLASVNNQNLDIITALYTEHIGYRERTESRIKVLQTAVDALSANQLNTNR